MQIVDFDLETRSRASIKIGSTEYAKHPSTEIMCMAYSLHPDDPPKIWKGAPFNDNWREPPEEFLAAIQDGAILRAHNSFFESNALQHVWKLPPLPPEQWRCTMAQALYNGLPRSLEKALFAMGIGDGKDMEGRKVMLQLSKPTRKGIFIEDPELYEKLYDYCIQDVVGQKRIAQYMPELTEYEQAVWEMDRRMNARGLRVDRELAQAAATAMEKRLKGMVAEFAELTDGLSAGQRAKFQEWFEVAAGSSLVDTKGRTLLRMAAKSDVPPHVKRACVLAEEINRKSAGKKWQSMLDSSDPVTGRVCGSVVYAGASVTRRFAGQGIQPHNFSRPPKGMDMVETCNRIIAGEELPISLLNGAQRGAIIPSEGKDLLVGDFSSIEPRMLFWLAGAMHVVEAMRAGLDLYCDMAGRVYRRTITKDENPVERQFGKVIILGLGYGMGFLKFAAECLGKEGIRFTRDECVAIVGSDYQELAEAVKFRLSEPQTRISAAKGLAQYGIALRDVGPELVLMLYVVNLYRESYHEVPEFWAASNQASRNALATRRPYVVNDKIEWRFEDNVLGGSLACELPSGHVIFYPQPKIRNVRTSWGEIRPGLTYSQPKSSGKKWAVVSTYGAKQVENQIQAVSRDAMCDGLLAVDERDEFDLLCSVHDEGIADGHEYDLPLYVDCMGRVGDWGKEVPIVVEAKALPRYDK